jgi:hypothetical protein
MERFNLKKLNDVEGKEKRNKAKKKIKKKSLYFVQNSKVQCSHFVTLMIVLETSPAGKTPQTK